MILVTFYSHYGAMLMKKRMGTACKLRPVPRALSSSCGTCACLEGIGLDEVREAAGETLEAVYSVTDGSYTLLFRQD